MTRRPRRGCLWQGGGAPRDRHVTGQGYGSGQKPRGGYVLGRVGRCVLLAALAAACNDIYGVNIGQIEITVTTTGADLDPDGYSLSLDGAAGLTFPLNATRTLTGVSTGSHSVLLSG